VRQRFLWRRVRRLHPPNKNPDARPGFLNLQVSTRSVFRDDRALAPITEAIVEAYQERIDVALKQ